jgi:hypothetical protein
LSNHLFQDYTCDYWWWNEEPFKQVQVVRNDGWLLNMTYVPDQEIYGWSHYDTQGMFISGCSIPEGNYNVVYVLTARYLPVTGQTGAGSWCYMVERFDNRQFQDVRDCWFLDCALATPLNNYAAIAAANPSDDDGGVVQIAWSDTTLEGIATVLSKLPVFPAASTAVGDVLYAGGGVFEITGLVLEVSGNYKQVAVTVLKLPTTYQGYTTNLLGSTISSAYLAQGNWEWGTPVSEVSGLNQLNGLTVNALIDGLPVTDYLGSPLVVENGSLALPFAGTKVLVGLPYTCQLQTLRLEMEGIPSQQGKLKTIPQVAVIVDKTLGISVGQGDFEYLDPVPETAFNLADAPAQPWSGIHYLTIPGEWDYEGQVCVETQWPLPVSVLGIVPEVLLGDTQG